MNSQKKAPSGSSAESVAVDKNGQTNPSTNGLLRLHQQACRLAVNAIHRDDKRLADGFGTVALTLEWVLNRKGVTV